MKYSDYEKQTLALELCTFMLKQKQKPVFLCIGSDKVVGDMVGVLVGEMLKNKYRINAHIYGTLSYAVTNKNLQEIVKKVKKEHNGSPIVIVDGILGKTEEIGQIKHYAFGSVPAGAFNKGKLIGDYSILGVVDSSGIDKMLFLKSVKLKTVVDMAQFIAESVNLAYKFGGVLV